MRWGRRYGTAATLALLDGMFAVIAGRGLASLAETLVADLPARPGFPPGFRACQLPPDVAAAALAELEASKVLPVGARTGELGTSFYALKARHDAMLHGIRLPRNHKPSEHHVEPLCALPICASVMRRAQEVFGLGRCDSQRLNVLARRYCRGGYSLPRHIDDPNMFDEPVLSLVLQGGSPDGLRLCRENPVVVAEAQGVGGVALHLDRGWRVEESPGTVVCLEGHARYHLMHEVPAVTAQRTSLTWRWFRQDFLDGLESKPLFEPDKHSKTKTNCNARLPKTPIWGLGVIGGNGRR